MSFAEKSNTTGNATVTATATATATPAPTASPSASPTPTPGPLFSNPYWNNDHVTVTVNNNLGQQIQVTAYLGSTSNNTKYIVDPGVTQTLDTPTINAANGLILNFGFIAYENGTELTSESIVSTVTVIRTATSTPVPPETVILSGTIVDSANQTPISGAEVTFLSTTYAKEYPVVTGPDGSFTTPKMYSDSYQITIKADGYKTGFGEVPLVVGTKILNPIGLDRQATPTQAPTVTPSPSPTSPLDSWIAIIYSPTVCVGTISSLIAVILGSIGIYEWLSKQRAARKKAESEAAQKLKGLDNKPGEKPADKPLEGDKK